MSDNWQLKRLALLIGSLSTGLVLGLLIISHTSTGSAAKAAELTAVSSPLNLVYRFNGVTDDGQKGSGSRKNATSVHCTNISPSQAQIEVKVYQWDGSTVYTATLPLDVNRSATISTQNTGIYFEDAILGGSTGTNAIFQGSGQIFSSTPAIICTAQALDPLNTPPLFAVRLKMFQPDGTQVGDGWETYLPIVLRP